MRQKEAIISALSGNVMDAIHRTIGSTRTMGSNSKGLKDDWIDTRGKIEDLWSIRLAGKQGDSEEVYALCASDNETKLR